jgi:uncharacterized protein (DUF2062 family)
VRAGWDSRCLPGAPRILSGVDVKGFLRRRIVEPLAAQLTQGVTPARLALAVALGMTIGVFPVLGSTTLLCAILAASLRLNQPAIQVANYLAYPLQLVLFLPFFRAGAWLLGAPSPAFTLAALQAQVARDPWGTLAVLGAANLRAVAAWAIAAAPAVILLFVVLRPALARLPLRRPPAESDPGDRG